MRGVSYLREFVGLRKLSLVSTREDALCRSNPEYVKSGIHKKSGCQSLTRRASLSIQSAF